MKVSRRFWGTCRLHLQNHRALLSFCSMPLSCFAYFWPSRYVPPETSVDFQRTTCRYIPEDRYLHAGCTWEDNTESCAGESHVNLPIICCGYKAHKLIRPPSTGMWSSPLQNMNIAACRPVGRQRPRNKQLHNSCCWVTAPNQACFGSNNFITAEELCFLRGPSRCIISGTN
jgi:hypothetical protein